MASLLIVDDDEGMVETLVDIMTVRHHHVSTARSAEAAVASVRQHVPDVVLMDIKMPGQDGVQALRAMEEISPDIKVIMMTALTSDPLVVEAYKSMALAILPKPLNLANLLGLVDRVTQSRGDAQRI